MTVKLKTQAYDLIRHKVLTGSVRTGSRLSDHALAREIGFSRTPIREAMNQLESEGLIQPHPKGGFVVRRPDRKELQELFELREVLEGYAAQAAAERITEAELDELQASVEQIHTVAQAVRVGKLTMLDGQLGERAETADAAFHMLIIRKAGNDQLAKITSDMRIATRVFGHRRYPPEVSLLWIVSRMYLHHTRVLRCLRRRDGRAAREWIEYHIRDGRRNTLKYFDWLEHEHGGEAPPSADWPDSLRKRVRQIERGGK